MSATTTDAQPLRRPRKAAKLERVVDVDSCFTTVCGVTVHHKRWEGQGRREVLCLHGFGASLTSYEPCVGRLRGVGTVHAFDLPGFGRTSRPGVTELWRYSPAHAAAIANELVPGRGVLVAHSMGALAAVEAACAKHVRTLVLVAPALRPPRRRAPPEFLRNAAAVAAVLLSLLVAPLVLLLLRRFVVREAFWRRGLALARGDPTQPVPDHIVDLYMRPIGWPGWDYGLLNFSRAMALYQAVAGHDAWRRLTHVVEAGTTVVIVHGDRDRVVPIANSRALVRAIPKIRLVEMEGLGHVPHEETPDQFANVVQGVIDGTLEVGRSSRVVGEVERSGGGNDFGGEPVVT